MNRVTPILATPLVSMSRFDHPPREAHRDPGEERAGAVSVSFVESGGFGLRVGRRRERLGPLTLFVTWPGLVFSCDHDQDVPADVCLTVALHRTFAEDVLAVAGRRRLDQAAVALTNRLAYLHLALVTAGEGDPLAAETAAGAVLAEVAGGSASTRLFRPAQLAWYARRVDAARSRLECEYAEHHSLLELARDAGMSPYHFARIFRELAGVPPHRYLRDVRLERAADRLRQGSSVTDACFECGFANLSHFTRSFRRRFGVPPSRLAG